MCIGQATRRTLHEDSHVQNSKPISKDLVHGAVNDRHKSNWWWWTVPSRTHIADKLVMLQRRGLSLNSALNRYPLTQPHLLHSVVRVAIKLHYVPHYTIPVTFYKTQLFSGTRKKNEIKWKTKQMNTLRPVRLRCLQTSRGQTAYSRFLSQQ